MSRILIISLIAGLVGAIAAERKGRNWLLWLVICILFPFAVIVILFLPPVLARGIAKKCPHCAEIVKHEATTCKHCGNDLPLEMVQCPSCGKYVPDMDYCMECRKALR